MIHELQTVVRPICNHTGFILSTLVTDKEDCAYRMRNIARALRHDLDNNPPKDERVREEAEARYQRYADRAAAYEVELKKARGY